MRPGSGRRPAARRHPSPSPGRGACALPLARRLRPAYALVDFPVTMITDDSRGQASGEAWSREQWTQVMRPFYEKPQQALKVTHRPNVFLLSDSLASLDDVVTMTVGGRTTTTRNSMLVIRRDGKWRVKAMAEGGWGDAQAPREPASAGPTR